MARNGSGTFTPPGSSFPAVASTLIESAKFNNVINDISSAVTASIANDGQTPILANLPMNGFKHTGVAAASASGQYVEYAQNVALLAAKADSSALSAKANAGANTDITSLQSTCTVTTQAAGNNSTRIASTAFVATSFAPLASPALTGNPTAPTPAATDNDTSIATTAFVNNFENDQAWTDLTGTRLNNTTYTNSTGRPITIRVGSSSVALSVISIIFTLDGVAMPGSVVYAHGTGYTHIDTLIVPNGSTYKAVATLGISSWWEYS